MGNIDPSCETVCSIFEDCNVCCEQPNGSGSVVLVIGVCFILRFRPVAEKSKDELVALGFPQFTIEDFHATVSVYLFLSFGLHSTCLVHHHSIAGSYRRHQSVM